MRGSSLGPSPNQTGDSFAKEFGVGTKALLTRSKLNKLHDLDADFNGTASELCGVHFRHHDP